jgi:hypothetical protein
VPAASEDKTAIGKLRSSPQPQQGQDRPLAMEGKHNAQDEPDADEGTDYRYHKGLPQWIPKPFTRPPVGNPRRHWIGMPTFSSCQTLDFNSDPKIETHEFPTRILAICARV